ncbi:MAG: GWxTD domain-containing protein [Candidatus Eisenbacteria bacterium]|uniref:GWxTD domain-containing protein n=1 Tax=Eiseniibacteriota bacterium TaxID=2212470 RepID=A0A933W393_UNCEI|nr:GWxTD domain-containing protein [Candidatus Eisenbacteria bacterium]
MFLALTLSIVLLAAAPAGAADLPLLRSFAPPYFSADVVVSMDSTARASVGVTFTVPYSELNWTRTPAGYGAGAGFSIVFEPDSRERLYGDSFDRRVLIERYDQTRSPRNNLLVTRRFDLPPGRYKVRLRVRDLGSDLESEASDRLSLQDLSRVPVGFADLQLGVIDSSGAFTVMPTRRFGLNAEDFAVRVIAFDRRPGEWPRKVQLHYRVVDESGTPYVQGDTTVTQARSADAVVVKPSRTDLFIGSYVIEVERVEGKSRWRTSRSFEVEESGPPRGRDFVQMLDALAYIATPEEVDGMRNLPPADQVAAWERFWRRRDPTPETARNEYQIEFFRRLHYADQHFSGFGPGWRSDMGRIYVRYGPPDQIEQRAASSTTPQLELWFYNQPYHRFVFADREGFGRYTLVQPSGE